MHNLLRCMVAAVLFSCAQWAVSADLVGTVRDIDGRIMSNSKVTLRSQLSGNTQTTQATGAGQFAFTGIPPGKYVLDCNGNESSKSDEPGFEVGAGINRRDCKRSK